MDRGKFEIHLFVPERGVYSEMGVDGPDEEVRWINRFLESGLERLHIRKPGFSIEETADYISRIDRRFYGRLILHDYPELALRYGCGFQFNGRWPLEEGGFASRSQSCHSVDEIKQCSGMDFVTLSPVFDSISKQGYRSAFANSDLHGMDLSKVVALGGVTAERIKELKARGFGGAALLGDVWHTDSGRERFLKFLLMRNFGLQFITNGRDVRETVEQARLMLDGGCRWIQVRMKEADPEEVREALQKIMPYCEAVGATLLVDDHYGLAAFCHGVHLGQEDERVAVVRETIGPEKIIGLTVNDINQIHESYAALPDYYGVGPFRLTTTKKRLAPVLGLGGYRRLAPEIPRPFVAIGGIRTEDIPALLQVGASGVAMSSSLIRAKDPVKEAERIIKIIEEYGE